MRHSEPLRPGRLPGLKSPSPPKRQERKTGAEKPAGLCGGLWWAMSASPPFVFQC